MHLTNSDPCKITFLFRMKLRIVQHTMSHLWMGTIEPTGAFPSLGSIVRMLLALTGKEIR